MDSSRITLRPYRSTDVDDLLSWASDDRVTRSIHFSTLTSKDEAFTFIDKSSIPWRRSICIDDRSVGIVVARPGSGDDRCRAEVGYALAVEYWGQGITPKAVKMSIPLILEEFPEIVRLQALTDAENKASHRVLEKAGFIKEGIATKVLKMAIPRVFNDFPGIVKLQAFMLVRRTRLLIGFWRRLDFSTKYRHADAEIDV
ncbi:hypothetical protein MTR67_005205 [Solanum verrucosum]|uniref:N-acetyltransferase domain-containing protein n=1 Tax=Solanum verrucosum TaxID=315347 RepID=A0AAF0PZ45_SOLVR|nr:hypothetical protein MTR67_005205 [Solanum verrucosum]